MYNLQDLSNKTALVTGASSGIGFQIAKFLAYEGCQVLALARREEKLKELQSLFPQKINYLAGDINDSNYLSKLEKKDAFNVDIMINNAGLALGKDHFQKSEDEDIEKVIQTNVLSSFKFVKRSLQSMMRNKIGDIINICSIASHQAYEGGAVYCATKHALLAFAKSLRHETYGENIRIINISPGMVETEFSKVRFKGDESKAQSVYKNFTPLTPVDIAYQSIHALKCPRHVNLDEVIVLTTDQAGATKVKRK